MHRAKTVLLYASYGSEVATDDLAKELLKRGKTVAYRLTTVAGLMTLWRVKISTRSFPTTRHSCRTFTRSATIEPLAGLRDLSRRRLHARAVAVWRGGGYFTTDCPANWRTTAPASASVSHPFGIMDLPQHDHHDAKVHWVVTEVTVYPYAPDPPVIVPVATAAQADPADANAAPAESAADAAGSRHVAARSRCRPTSTDPGTTIMTAIRIDGNARRQSPMTASPPTWRLSRAA